ncbi:unnamed protein product [Closterium sp. NIES-53]
MDEMASGAAVKGLLLPRLRRLTGRQPPTIPVEHPCHVTNYFVAYKSFQLLFIIFFSLLLLLLLLLLLILPVIIFTLIAYKSRYPPDSLDGRKTGTRWKAVD